MALYEDVTYSKKGVLAENSFMQYKIPSRMEFESSYEPTEPFGAKSIGEIVINTPSLMRLEFGYANSQLPRKKYSGNYIPDLHICENRGILASVCNDTPKPKNG